MNPPNDQKMNESLKDMLAASLADSLDVAILETPPEAESNRSQEKEPKIQPVFAGLADIQIQPKSWLIPGRFLANAVHVISGPPKSCKSNLLAWLAAMVSTGGELPDGTRCPQGNVIFFPGEDDLADTFVPRLKANGADLNYIDVLQGHRLSDGKTFDLQSLNVRLLEAAIRHREEATGLAGGIIVIDPVGDYLSGTKESSNSEVRSVISPLQKLASEHGYAIFLVHHNRKNSANEAKNPGSAMEAIHGSVAFTAVARCNYIIFHDQQSDTRKFLCAGANFQPPPGIEFRIQECLLTDKVTGQEVSTEKVQIVEYVLNENADDYLQQQKAGAGKPTKCDQAKVFLTEYLSEGKRYANDVIAAAKEYSNIGETNLRKAFQDIGGRFENDERGRSCWFLEKTQKIVNDKHFT